MGKYFGTDGVRGRANEGLNLDIAIKIGQYLGTYYGKTKHAKILIGKDTRISSSMFENGLAAGASSCGANVYLLGVCPTPSVSYLVAKEDFDCGIMVSASHNPYYDNGIKLFNSEGKKMDQAILDLVEDYIDGKIKIEPKYDAEIGEILVWQDGILHYKDMLKEHFEMNLCGYNIALDLANGSATSCAADVLRSLGAHVEVIHARPNGVNINTKCGSTQPKSLSEFVKQGDFHAGFAFDGDADRLIAVDEDGNIIDGDAILYICSNYMSHHKLLKDNIVVTTIMSNIGLYKALDRADIQYKQTDVGDKYVFECMSNENYSLGGEQSGHIIFKEYANTGDGLLSALYLLRVMNSTKQSLKQLSEDLFIYPQLLINVKVKDKKQALNDKKLDELVASVAQKLGNDGRILVRPSGTEPIIRVMVEAKTSELCDLYVNEVVSYVKMKGL
ncbi:MAG: phosphoglucosamine mutase [Erysipelotrichaceae bacterium]